MGPSSEPPCTPRHREIFEAYLNGGPVSEDVLSPGWSSYEWRLRYRSYDVTALHASRPSVLGIALGNGWFRGRLGWSGGRRLLRRRLGAHRAAGDRVRRRSRQVVVTDETWTAGPSAT